MKNKSCPCFIRIPLVQQHLDTHPWANNVNSILQSGCSAVSTTWPWTGLASLVQTCHVHLYQTPERTPHTHDGQNITFLLKPPSHSTVLIRLALSVASVLCGEHIWSHNSPEWRFPAGEEMHEMWSFNWELFIHTQPPPPPLLCRQTLSSK